MSWAIGSALVLVLTWICLEAVVSAAFPAEPAVELGQSIFDRENGALNLIVPWLPAITATSAGSGLLFTGRRMFATRIVGALGLAVAAVIAAGAGIGNAVGSADAVRWACVVGVLTGLLLMAIAVNWRDAAAR